MKVLTKFILCLTWLPTFSQDANYWSSEYGPGAFFTPGSVLSYNRDSGVFFYNPALLAYSNKSAASIQSTVYQYNKIHVNDGAGEGYDLKSGLFSVIPLIASHTVPLKLKRPVTIVYGIVNRPVMAYQTSQRIDELKNVLDDSHSPGSELYIGQFTTSNLAAEIGGVISAGMKLTDRFSAGISFEGKLYRRHNMYQTQARALENVPDSNIFPPVVSVEEFYEVYARTIGLRIKVGGAYEINDHHHLGLLLTFPMIRIGGKGSILADLEINGINIAPGQPFNLLASTYQTDLKSYWKMPFSASLGYTWIHNRGMLYLSAEYFGQIDEYNVLSPQNKAFVRPDSIGNSVSSDLLRYRDARKAILNAGFGLSYLLSKKITGYLSLRTDFNFLDLEKLNASEGFIAAVSRWDTYHMQLGANVHLKKVSVRAGILLSYGNTSEFPQIMNFNSPTESNYLTGDTGNTDAKYMQAGLMVSYLYNF